MYGILHGKGEGLGMLDSVAGEIDRWKWRTK